MPSDNRSDEHLIEAAYRVVVDLRAALWLKDGDPNAFDDGAVTALGKRLILRTEERQAARDALAVVRVCANDVVSAGQEITARICLELGTMERP